jgi:hypothetical protein
MFSSIKAAVTRKRARKSGTGRINKNFSRKGSGLRKFLRREPEGSAASLISRLAGLDLDEDRDQARRDAFKVNLGKLLRAHDSNWKRVPMFFFVDSWIDDSGDVISVSKLHTANVERKKFGINK